MTKKMQMFLRLLPLVAGLALLAAWGGRMYADRRYEEGRLVGHADVIDGREPPPEFLRPVWPGPWRARS